MSELFAGMKRQLERNHRRTRGFGAIWAELVPDELAEYSTIRSYQQGILTIAVRDAAARFELDRLLRTGLETELRARAPATLRRIRLLLT